MAMLKAIAKSLSIVAVLYLVFRYLASFSGIQSLVLVLGGWWVWRVSMDLAAVIRAEKVFSPFWVRVSPKWYELLRDHRIAPSDEEKFWEDAESAWRELQKERADGSEAVYRTLRDDIVFTVLKPGVVDGLIYWNSRRIFRSEIHFEERIEEVRIGPPKRRTGFGWSPGLYFKWGRDGYELGLEVNASWWEEVCADDTAKQLVKIMANPQHLTGTTRLLVATLPYSEFAVYTEGNASPSWQDAVTQEKRERSRDAELAKAGWKREEKDAELDLLGAPNCVEHKYFKIEHRVI